jgi:hypothetical protein
LQCDTTYILKAIINVLKETTFSMCIHGIPGSDGVRLNSDKKEFQVEVINVGFYCGKESQWPSGV